MDNNTKKDYIEILKRELLPAMGCTEPIALAYAVAYARKLLGRMPSSITVKCSGNIIKNTMAVTVPSTGGLRGIKAAALAGAIGGDADKQLEVLTTVTDEDRKEIKRLVNTDLVKVEALDSTHALHIIAEVKDKDEYATVELVDTHTNFGHVEVNGKVLNEKNTYELEDLISDEAALTVEGIIEFTNSIDLDEIKEVLERQIEYNSKISDEGLTNDWGACVGKTLLSVSDDIYTRIKAAAAAGSDARMSGCLLPVVINCGSGNQGITVTMPIVTYGKHIGASHEKILRALCLADLIAVHQKSGIGRLSAFCGALCAATAGVCGIAYMNGETYEVISQIIVNSLANVGGMVCDGAKASCAAKIASSLDCALMAYELAKKNRGFKNGEGIVKADVEKTIASVGRMASQGMRLTDREILDIMLD